VLERGRVLARKYVLDRPAGFGGMSQLWVATNRTTGADVCVKVLVPDPERRGHGRDLVERFRREAHAAARLSHRAIVRVFDLLELDEDLEAVAKGDAPYAYAIVMELLRGETLGDMLAKRGKIPLEEALDLFLPVVSALGHAHRASVIHRDLKPDNLFLATDPDGHVLPKVLDFGVSKLQTADALTVDGVLVGTPTFMSPEQASGARHIDARSDVFSLGILFYMMLSGRNPFEDAPTFAATLDVIIHRTVAPIPELPGPIWSVLERAIEKEPHLRFESADELGTALRGAAGLPAPADSNPSFPSASHLVRPFESGTSSPATGEAWSAPADVLEHVSGAPARRRRGIVVAVVSAASALLIASLVVTVIPSKRPEAELPSTKDGLRAASAQLASAPALVEVSADPVAVAEQAPPAAKMGSPSSFVPATPPKATAGRPPAAPRPGAGVPAAGPPPRKAGAEPHNARDPGF